MKNPISSMPNLDITRLNWDRVTHQLAGMASDFGLPPGGGFVSLYDDAMDVGLAVVHRKTNRHVVFVLADTEVRDGDVLAWTLTPAWTDDGSPTIVKELILFND